MCSGRLVVDAASKTGVSRLQQGAVLDAAGSQCLDSSSVFDGAYPLIHANAQTETNTWRSHMHYLFFIGNLHCLLGSKTDDHLAFLR